MATNVTKLVAAIVLALGLAAAGFLLGQSILATRLADRTVEVRGLAERDVKADLAVWPIRFVVTGDDLGAAAPWVDLVWCRPCLDAGRVPDEV